MTQLINQPNNLLSRSTITIAGALLTESLEYQLGRLSVALLKLEADQSPMQDYTTLLYYEK